MDAPTPEQPSPEQPAPKQWTWPRLVVVTLARALLAGLLGLAAWGSLPAAAGWHPTTVSSGSMLPRLHVGDVAVSRPLGAHVPALGSVLLFDDPDHPGRLRLHRFVRLEEDGLLVTRGDANADDDSSPVPLSAVHGIGTLRVPWLGLPVTWLRDGSWVALALTAAGIGLLLVVATSGRDRAYADDEPPDAGTGPVPEDEDVEAAPVGGGRSPWAAPLRRAVVGTVAGIVALGPAVPAGAAFSATTTAAVDLAATPWFSCGNAVTALAPTVWYAMDETSSTTTVASDSSGNGRTGVYGSGGKTSVTTRACARDTGRAMTFNGSTGYLSSPQLSGALPNTFSVAIWFRTTTRAGGKLIGFGNVRTGASGVYDRHVYMTNAGQLVFGVYPGAVRTVVSSSAYNDNVWHLAVATLSSAGMRLYADGALVASDPSTTSGEGASNGYLRIGYDNLDSWTSTPSSRFFAGTLDDAAYFSSALTAAQVASMYEAGT